MSDNDYVMLWYYVMFTNFVWCMNLHMSNICNIFAQIRQVMYARLIERYIMKKENRGMTCIICIWHDWYYVNSCIGILLHHNEYWHTLQYLCFFVILCRILSLRSCSSSVSVHWFKGRPRGTYASALGGSCAHVWAICRDTSNFYP